MLVSRFLLIVTFVCLEHHSTKQGTQVQVHVSPGMLYNEERRECQLKANIK